MKRKRPARSRAVTILGTVELTENDNSAVLVTDYGEELYLEIPNQRTLIHEYANQYVKVNGTIFERDGWLTVAAKRISFADPDEQDSGDIPYGYDTSLDDWNLDDDAYYSNKSYDRFD